MCALQVQLKAKQTAKRLLKMPPVLPVRSPKDEVLERDEKLEGATEHTMIFTDTTHHKLNRVSNDYTQQCALIGFNYCSNE